MGQRRVPGVEVGVEGQPGEERYDPQQAGRQKGHRPPHLISIQAPGRPDLLWELDFGEAKFKTEDGVAGPPQGGKYPSPAHSRPARSGKRAMDVVEGVLRCALLEPCFVGGGMTRIAVFRSLAVAMGAVSMLAACGPGNPTTSENLASDQTLRF